MTSIIAEAAETAASIPEATTKEAKATEAIETIEEAEARIVRWAEHPITFEMFLDLNVDSQWELIDGVMVKRMAAQWEHESFLVWLVTVLNGYVRQKNLGSVAVTNFTVKIDQYHGRLPDLLFVRRERENSIESRFLNGPADLVLEILSPNDRPSHTIALEADYRAVRVPEIVFINPQKRSVRLLRLRDTDYEETELTVGTLTLETIPGFALEVEWFFNTPRPNEFDLLTALLKP